jgi:salicylate hydroxylase
VVLLGDAAHAMLPYQGQGANQTIEDAAVLAAELDGATGIPAGIPVALGRYAARRRVRTRQVQLVSWAASAALHLPDGPAAQRRDASLPGTPRDLAWIHGYDLFAPATGRGARCSAAAGSPSTRPARSPAVAARPSRKAAR